MADRTKEAALAEYVSLRNEIEMDLKYSKTLYYLATLVVLVLTGYSVTRIFDNNFDYPLVIAAGAATISILFVLISISVYTAYMKAAQLIGSFIAVFHCWEPDFQYGWEFLLRVIKNTTITKLVNDEVKAIYGKITPQKLITSYTTNLEEKLIYHIIALISSSPLIIFYSTRNTTSLLSLKNITIISIYALLFILTNYLIYRSKHSIIKYNYMIFAKWSYFKENKDRLISLYFTIVKNEDT
ncbi:hypothetical protein HQ587_08415 [bacterium]|nr:hypothetical protein [bacterium]